MIIFKDSINKAVLIQLLGSSLTFIKDGDITSTHHHKVHELDDKKKKIETNHPTCLGWKNLVKYP